MACEWVSPSATAVTAVLGLYFTWLTGRQGREHARAVSRETSEAAQRLARDARESDAYVDLLAFVTQAGYTLSALNSIAKLADDPEPLALPEPDAQALYSAKVHAHGTAEVIQRSELWNSHAQKMIVNTRQLRLAEELQRKGLDVGVDVSASYVQQAEELAKLTKSAENLTRQINQELAG